jgi:type 1 glutamine amidotransferase
MMKIAFIVALVAAAAAGCATSVTHGQTPKKALVVTATFGFTHSCIPMSEGVLTNISQKSGAFTIVDFIRSGPQPQNPDKEKQKELIAAWKEGVKKEMAEKMSPEGLKKYDIVIFDNTTGDLPVPSMDGLLSWITNGGAFAGIHAASDTFHGSPAFLQMLGGEFKQHGAQVKVECLNQDPEHPATKHLGPSYEVFDEIYQFKNFSRPTVHGLLGLDKHPNNHTPGDYPVSWCKQIGKGKVFYTSLGHREDVWESDKYQQHVLGGIKWALGLEPGSAIPQVKE